MSVERGSRAAGVRSLVEAANAEPGASYDGDDHEDTTYDAEDLTHPDVAMMKASRDVRKPFREFSLIEKVEYVFVRFTLISACIFVLLGVLASLLLSALLFSMGMKEVLFDAVQAWAGYSPSAWCRPRLVRWTGSSSAWSASCSASDRSSSSSRGPTAPVRSATAG